jgi:hypothetical protein
MPLTPNATQRGRERRSSRPEDLLEMDHGASATPCRISDGLHDFNHRERWLEAESRGNMIY